MGQAERRLRQEEREFLSKVRAAIFCNPFSDERQEIDQNILGMLPPTGSATTREKDDLLAGKVARRLEEIVGGATVSTGEYAGEDRVLLEYGVLFSVYHRFCDALDGLIREQLAAGQTPCPVRFARECLGRITERGISTDAAEHFFALFFQLRRAFYFIDLIVGVAPSVKTLRRDLWNNVFTCDIGLYEQFLWNRMEDFSTILLGETGTGKGMAAAAIGRSGFIPWEGKRGCFAESFTRAFVSLNLSQFPQELLESELFGHQKGAFTGAMGDHEGLFARCSPYGAIFLDEIGEVGVPVQIKLLNVLQDRLFSPVGSHRHQRFEGRVIAATNQDLESLRHRGRFRDDFYYRLCSDSIQVPPLRTRLQEDPTELQRLLERTVERILGSPARELAAMIGETIGSCLPPDYPWPGNVRELEQCARRILLKRGYAPQDRVPSSTSEETLVTALQEGSLSARELLTRYCCTLYRRLGSYDAVARRVELDWRTVKKYVESSP